MELKCAFCAETGSLREMHGHLVEAHLGHIAMEEVEEGKRKYSVACPLCDFEHVRQVNPRGRNPRFLEEFRAEIALVAFDQLIYHLLQEHPQAVGLDPDALA